MEVWTSVCRSFNGPGEMTENMELFTTREAAIEYMQKGVEKLVEWWEQQGPVYNFGDKTKDGDVICRIDLDEGVACIYKKGASYEDDYDECFVEKKIVHERMD